MTQKDKTVTETDCVEYSTGSFKVDIFIGFRAREV